MEDLPKKENLFFLDTVSDAKIYSGKEGLLGQESRLFIAMNPATYSFLYKKRAFVNNTLAYFKNDSHEQAIGQSKILVDWFREKSIFSNTFLGVNIAYQDTFIFFIRSAIHYCLYNIEVICNAVKFHQPDLLSVSLSGKRRVASGPYIGPEDKYFGRIVERISQKESLCFKYFATKKTGNIFYFQKAFFSLPRFILKYMGFKLWESNILMERLFDKNKIVLFTAKKFRMDNFMGHAREEHAKTRHSFLPGPIIENFKLPDFIIKLLSGRNSKDFFINKTSITEISNLIKEKADFFSYRGIYFGDILCEKIEEGIAEYILQLFLSTLILVRSLDKLKPALILCDGSRMDDALISEVCKAKGIPVMFVSHGSFVCPKNKFEAIEWNEFGRLLLGGPFSYLALQTPLSEGYLKAFPPQGKIVRTGPLIWGNPVNFEKSKLLFNKLFKENYNFRKIKVILYANTPKRRIRFYTYETNDEYTRSMHHLTDAVKNIANSALIVRFREFSDELKIEDLNTYVKFSEKIILSVKEPFLDVLGIADLLVSFSSTTIEEALQNRIPVLLYGGAGRYRHIPAFEVKAGSLLERRAVYHVKEAKDLEYAISNILSLGIGRDNDAGLFNQYIYAQDEKESIFDLF